jgi:hypothetical protein
MKPRAPPATVPRKMADGWNVGAGAAAAAGLVCLWYGVVGWAVFFLVVAALNLTGGGWYITIARSASVRT